jgi:aminoglycoside 6'-N-acetyltransferase
VGLPDVELRELRRTDLPLLARWLAEPLVARWWAHETTPDAVERDFGPSIDGADATALHLGWAAYDGAAARPFGLVQVYPIEAYPEYVEELTPDNPADPRDHVVHRFVRPSPPD